MIRVQSRVIRAEHPAQYYKGSPPRAWIRVRFLAADGSIHERELLADTGSPCAVILGQDDLSLLTRLAAKGANCNFSQLTGGWLRINIPELELTKQVRGFGSDRVLHAVKEASADFAGLVGLPLLRLAEYGGDANEFWLRCAMDD